MDACARCPSSKLWWVGRESCHFFPCPGQCLAQRLGWLGRRACVRLPSSPQTSKLALETDWAHREPAVRSHTSGLTYAPCASMATIPLMPSERPPPPPSFLQKPVWALSFCLSSLLHSPSPHPLSGNYSNIDTQPFLQFLHPRCASPLPHATNVVNLSSCPAFQFLARNITFRHHLTLLFLPPSPQWPPYKSPGTTCQQAPCQTPSLQCSTLLRKSRLDGAP